MEQLMKITPATMPVYSVFLPDSLKEEYLFGKELLFYGIAVADIACGLIVLKPDGRVMELVYLYLAEDYRGRGLASRMLGELWLELDELGYEAVTAHYLPSDVPSLDRTLRSYGFRTEKTGHGTFRFPMSALTGNKYLKGEFPHVESLKELSDMQLREICNEIVEDGMALVTMPIDRDDYLADCSGVLVEGSDAQGMILLRRKDSNTVQIPLLYSRANGAGELMELFCFLYQKAAETLPEDTICEMHVVQDTLTVLLEKLLNLDSERQVRAVYALSGCHWMDHELDALLM